MHDKWFATFETRKELEPKYARSCSWDRYWERVY